MSGNPIEILKLSFLSKSDDGYTSSLGSTFAEAAAVCLNERSHKSEKNFNVYGNYERKFILRWQDVTDQMNRSYNDNEVATEYGAYGIAFLLVYKLTDFKILEKSCKGTGFDFWIGKTNEDSFQDKIRLEVSGIRNGNKTVIDNRVNIKLKQVERSNNMKINAFIIVVEFGTPCAKVAKKW